MAASFRFAAFSLPSPMEHSASRRSPFATGFAVAVGIIAIAFGALWLSARNAGDTPAGAAIPAQTADSTHTPDGIRIHGAAPGEWTHDWNAARELARRQRLPFLALFTASDWNRWHKFLAQRVLDTAEWKEWAVRRRVVLAWVNIPNDESLLPAGAKPRNMALARELGATAYPAAMLVAPVAGRAIDRYHVTNATSAEEFISWLQTTWLDNLPGGPKPLLSDADRTALETLRETAAPLEKEYARVLQEEHDAHDVLVAKKVSTEALAAWAKESDARIAAARAPFDAIRREIDVYYAKAMDAAVP